MIWAGAAPNECEGQVARCRAAQAVGACVPGRCADLVDDQGVRARGRRRPAEPAKLGSRLGSPGPSHCRLAGRCSAPGDWPGRRTRARGARAPSRPGLDLRRPARGARDRTDDLGSDPAVPRARRQDDWHRGPRAVMMRVNGAQQIV